MRQRYGGDCYVFTHWETGAPGRHIPGSPADLGRPPHKPFPEERRPSAL